MALPHTFANVTELDTPALDDNFNALGALTIIPCACTGTNTIALVPASNTPTITSYKNLAPMFSFIAVTTSTGPVTVNVAGVGAVNLYKANGNVAAGSNDIILGYVYYIGYNSALNSGAGGFVLVNPSFVSTTSQYIIGSTSNTVATAATVYLGTNGAQTNQNASLCVVAKAGTLNSVYVATANAPGGGQSYSYTLYKNNVSTSVAGSISGAAFSVFLSGTPISVVQGDVLSVQLICSATATPTFHRYSYEIDP